jgi:cyclase
MSTLILNVLESLRSCAMIDLSKDVNLHRPESPFRTRMEVLEAKPGAVFFAEKAMPAHFPEGVGKITPESFPDGAFLRHEMLTISTHAGSHVDAPGHYGGPLTDASFIGAAPLQSFIAQGIFFDATAMKGDEVRWPDVEAQINEYNLGDLDGRIALFRVGHRAVSGEVVGKLLDRGVTIIGTDHDSLDGPFDRMLRLYLETGDRGVLWPAHMLGRTRPYYQLENLSNLDKLPRKDFLVMALPILVGGATASWSRVVAFVPPQASRSVP